MKFVLIVMAIIFCSCETNRFDADKRQIIAKDEIRRNIKGRITQFDVESFGQDTLASYPDSAINHPIRYTLHFTYKDSAGTQVQKTGSVLFNHNGTSILTSEISDQP